MNMTLSTERDHYEQARAVRAQAAHDLYEAELALHDAHQTQVDTWILAASNHLHTAVLTYTRAEHALAALSTPAAG